MKVPLRFIVPLIGLVLSLYAPPAQAQNPDFTNKVNIQPQAQADEPLGQLGGPVSAVAVQGNYAYVGVGPRLLILDISVPANPTVVGRTQVLSDIVKKVAVAGNYAYVIAGFEGLHIIDISNPATPITTGFYSYSWIAEVVVAGNYAYLAAGDGLRIIDISNPAAPTQVGHTSLILGSATDVAVAGGYAYLATGNGGLSIVNISNPAAPTQVSSFRTTFSAIASGVAVAGNYAYIVSGAADLPGDPVNLHILDVSNPTAPAKVGVYPVGASFDVKVVGNYAYVTATSGKLRIISISVPTTPTEVGSYDVTGNLVVASSYAYVADSLNRLHILNISNPATPTQTGLYTSPGWAIEVALSGNYAYVVGGAKGLGIIDISNPAVPTMISFYPISEFASRLAVAGNYAYVSYVNDGAPTSGGLRVIDISNPAAPLAVGVLAFPTGAVAADMTAVGNYVYIAAGGDDLRIIDVSNPAAPTEVAVYPAPYDAEGVAVAGNYLYFTDLLSGLHILDISNPTVPGEVGSYTPPDDTGRVAVAGNYAYVTASDSGLRIVDVSNPATPVEIGFYDTSGSAVDVAVDGGYAYVTEHSYSPLFDQLHIINISNPATPVEIGVYNMWKDAFASGIVVSGNYAYVADSDGGLVIFQVTSPTTATIPTTGGALTSTPDQTSYIFPSGAFTATTLITHTARLPGNGQPQNGLVPIGRYFDVTAVNSGTGQPVQPTQPYTITLHYTDAGIGPAIEETLALYEWTGSAWVKETSSLVDPASNTLTAQPTHFSLWAALAETQHIYLPVIDSR